MESSLVKNLMTITLFGSEWVLWLLIGLSILSLSVMVERFLFYRRSSVGNFPAFLKNLNEYLSTQDLEQAKLFCKERNSMESQVAVSILENFELEPEAIERLVASRVAVERKSLDRGLMVLGTLGNNTPFIGLFGTILGIIMAFHALGQNPTGGSSVVMAGISEALVATAVGLVVAIPAVIAFNAFQRVVRNRLSNSEAVRELIMSHAIQAHANRRLKAS